MNTQDQTQIIDGKNKPNNLNGITRFYLFNVKVL